jgi:YVTN family beta-propeller protein
MKKLLLVAAAFVFCTITIAAQNKVRIIQTNSAGDNVSLIDPKTNKVVGEITGIEAGHGAGASPDGKTIYVSNEADSTLEIVDAKTLKVTASVPLTPIRTTWPSARTASMSTSASSGTRRRGRDRHDHASEGQERADQGHDSQRLRDAGREVRRRRLDRRKDDQRDRRKDQ